MYKRKVIVIVLVVIAFFFSFKQGSVVGVSILEIVSSSALYPLLRIQRLVIEPIVLWINRSLTIQELERAIKILQKKYDGVVEENIALKAIYCYEEETKELRNFKKKYTHDLGHIAQVLARHFSENGHFFLVDAGSSHGIKKEMIAFYCNAIIGKVVEVYPWYCKICLITDADCKIASVCSKSGALGIHEGINNVCYTVIRYMSHLESVNVNELVLSSGEGLVFPKGFALGNVISAEKKELFYDVIVRPIFDLKTLDYCMLIARENI